MNLPTRRLHDFFANVYVAFFGAVASIVALILWFVDKNKLGFAFFIWWILIPIAFLLLSGIAIYSIKVRQENIQFRNFMKTLHRVNHNYRDALCAVFKHPSPEFTEAEYLNHVKQNEHKTVKSACEKIAKIYTAFTHCECMVTVKLVGSIDGKAFCETYERSEENCERDAGLPRKFNINTGENTAFDRAIMYAPGAVSRFHSADLDKEKGYRNQRDHWDDFYRCAIVVPIRSVNPMKIGNKDCSHDMGFLSVDTLSTNRLNDTWHVELLAAFADQMYNFLSLTKGKYSLRNSADSAVTSPHSIPANPPSQHIEKPTAHKK